jgi:5'-3' exonuclease
MATGLKEKIKDAIDSRSNDVRFLTELYSMIEKYNEEEVVCFDTKGNALTKNQLEAKVKAASERVKNGNFLTSEEVKKNIDSW